MPGPNHAELLAARFKRTTIGRTLRVSVSGRSPAGFAAVRFYPCGPRCRAKWSSIRAQASVAASVT
jgi:hypothetical protein